MASSWIRGSPRMRRLHAARGGGGRAGVRTRAPTGRSTRPGRRGRLPTAERRRRSGGHALGRADLHAARGGGVPAGVKMRAPAGRSTRPGRPGRLPPAGRRRRPAGRASGADPGRRGGSAGPVRADALDADLHEALEERRAVEVEHARQRLERRRPRAEALDPPPDRPLPRRRLARRAWRGRRPCAGRTPSPATGGVAGQSSAVPMLRYAPPPPLTKWCITRGPPGAS